MVQSSRKLSQSEIVNEINSSHKLVKDWAHLHKCLETMRDSGWIFRGVEDPLHYPRPSIGRESIFGPYKLAQEMRLFAEFKRRAVALVADARFDDWSWLAYAQHIGVPTRLLDWSTSPLTALFFAISGDSKTDRAIYALKYSQYVNETEQTLSPFETKHEGRFTAPMIFDRIRVQRGVFTVHPDPTRIFYRKNMRVLIIKADHLLQFRKSLYKYGIDHWHIYPDLQGLGQQLKWQYQYKIGLGSLFMR